MAALVHVFSAHVEELVEKVVAEAAPPVSCLIADTFFVWPSALAKKFGLLCVSFWTEPALVFTLYYHMDLLRKHGHFDCSGNLAPPQPKKIHTFFFNYNSCLFYDQKLVRT